MSGTGGNVLLLVTKEILGAAIVGLVVSYILFKVLKMTREPIVHILISLLDVSLAYVLCEHFGFSGVIASVICGMYFSYQTKKNERWKEVVDSKELYNDFWNVLENLLNSILFVLVGLSILSMEVSMHTWILIPIAILLNILTRYIGVLTTTTIIGDKNIPGKLSKKGFIELMTWCGLKGGLSLALAMTTKSILSSRRVYDNFHYDYCHYIIYNNNTRFNNRKSI